MSRPVKNLLHEYAKAAAETIIARVVRKLQRTPGPNWGYGTPLRSLWDEICVRHQVGHVDMYWDECLRLIEVEIWPVVEALPIRDKCALWLQTDAGRDWLWDAFNPDSEQDTEPDELDALPPFSDDDVVHYFAREYMIPLADDFTNTRIRLYLDLYH